MQPFWGKIRLLTRHEINSSKFFAVKSINGCPISNGTQFSLLDSKSFSSNRVIPANSHGYLSGLLPEFASHSTFIFHKKFGSGTDSLALSRNNDIATVAPFYRDAITGLSQLAARVPTFRRRCITTMGDSIETVSQDTSASVSDVPQRIKFKRLDKTAKHIMQILDKEAVEEVKARREIPDIRPGYIIQLKLEVPENKRRVSTIKGIVIARRNAGLNTTFRLRRLVAGVGVESLFPLYSPNIKEIKVLDKKKVRRAKLYYLRDKMNPLKKH